MHDAFVHVVVYRTTWSVTPCTVLLRNKIIINRDVFDNSKRVLI